SENGIGPDPSKISAVQNFPVPKNAKQVKSFLGLASYYRKFIKNFSQIAKPLNDLLKQNVKFEWNPICDEAFQVLKSRLISPPILSFPDFTKEFILTTDASQFAIGSVLSQGEIGKDLPISFASRVLNKAEQHYSTIERELLSIVWSVKHFRPYLLTGRSAQRLQKVQNSCCRFVTSTRKYAHVTPKYCELGWLKLAEAVKLHYVVFVHKLLST